MRSHKAFFDQKASSWEKESYPQPIRERLKALVAEFGIRDGASVLDIGTGPGILLPHLKRLVGDRGRICALDLSFQMIRQAANKPLTHHGWVLQADAHRIPFRAAVFDFIICFAAFPHFENPETVLEEMARVLISGGTLMVAHLLSRHELARHHAAQAAVARDVLPDEAQMRALLQQAGFRDIHITDKPGRYLARAIRAAG
jgi:ubiquinone/menaquinone biosynthesis C-methylase UbiE